MTFLKIHVFICILKPVNSSLPLSIAQFISLICHGLSSSSVLCHGSASWKRTMFQGINFNHVIYSRDMVGICTRFLSLTAK